MTAILKPSPGWHEHTARMIADTVYIDPWEAMNGRDRRIYNEQKKKADRLYRWLLKMRPERLAKVLESALSENQSSVKRIGLLL